MQDNPNTDNPPIETEAWEIAFKPYASYPDAAYDLARYLTAVKHYLETKPPDVSAAAQELDEVCDILFPFTEFYKTAYDLYRVVIEGRATRAHENLMESLGIRY